MKANGCLQRLCVRAASLVAQPMDSPRVRSPKQFEARTGHWRVPQVGIPHSRLERGIHSSWSNLPGGARGIFQNAPRKINLIHLAEKNSTHHSPKTLVFKAPNTPSPGKKTSVIRSDGKSAAPMIYLKRTPRPTCRKR